MRYFGPARLALLAAAMALSAFLGSPPPVLGASFTVDATNDAVDVSPGDGVCEDAGGACTLRAAVMETNALPGADEISLPAGTYVLSIPGAGENASATGDLDVTGDLTLTGAGAAATVIDGGGLDRVFHVVTGASDVTSGLAVQNGSALDGGGIKNEGILDLSRSQVLRNEAAASPQCPGACAPGSGGGFSNFGTADLLDVTISENRADVGGGIINFGSASITLSLGAIVANTATSEGGALSNFGNIEISDTGVTDNQAGSTGGAIDNDRGNFRIVNTLLARNQSDFGGALYNQDSSQLSNVTVSGNLARISGGGILNVGATHSITATNVTIANNDAPVGGGIYNGSVDGIGEAGMVSLVNTIVALNHSGGDCSGPITSGGHNANVDGTCALAGAGDFPHSELDLGALANNGGPTLTHALPRLDQRTDVVIRDNAIDGGDAASCPATDQRGEPRPFDGDGDGAAICDIGAFELREAPLKCEPGPCGVQFATPSPTPALPIALPPTGGAGAGDGFPLAPMSALAALAMGAGAAALWRLMRRR